MTNDPNQRPPAAPIDPHALADALELVGTLTAELDLLATLVPPNGREAAVVRTAREVTRGLAVALAHVAGPALLEAIAADLAAAAPTPASPPVRTSRTVITVLPTPGGGA